MRKDDEKQNLYDTANLSNTAELLKDVDMASIEYDFSVDDILSEFGVERRKPPEPLPVEPEQPEESESMAGIYDEIAATIEQERAEAEVRRAELRHTAEVEAAQVAAAAEEQRQETEREVAADLSAAETGMADSPLPESETTAPETPEEAEPEKKPYNPFADYPDEVDERVQEIEQSIRMREQDPPANDFSDTGRVHVIELLDEEPQKKKPFWKKNQPDEEEHHKAVVREASAAKGLFKDGIEDIFGEGQGLDAARKVGKKTEAEEFPEETPPKKGLFRFRKKTPVDIEKQMFGDDDKKKAELPPETEQNIPIDERLQEVTGIIGRSKLRNIGAFLLAAVLCVWTMLPKAGIELPEAFSYVFHPYRYLFLQFAAEILIMLLCFDTVATGVRDLCKLKPNMESVAALSSIACIGHILSVMAFPEWEGYLPFTAVTSLSLTITASCRRRWLVACARSYRAVQGMAKPNIVCAEPDYYDGDDAVAKYKAQTPLYFVNQTERTDFARRAWRVLAPIVIASAAILSAVSTVGRGEPQRFLWCLSAMLAAGAPLSLALPYDLPFAKATKHLAGQGEVIAGWSAAESLGSQREVVVTDSDIFPRGSVVLSGLKVFGSFNVDQVICYSASLISASGAGIARPFEDLLKDQSGTLRKVTSFKFYENGGIGGEIEGHSVLAGTAAFMARTGIRVPRDVSGKTMIFVAINQELAGIFAVGYNASGSVRTGFRILERHGLTPVFAVRDFNITPAMIESKFKLSTDTVDFPQIAQRLALSDPDRLFFGKPSAVLNREGLNHYAESIAAAKNLRKTTKICFWLSVICMLIAMLLMFYLTYIHAPATASPSNLLLYMLLWLLPVWLAAGWVNVG